MWDVVLIATQRRTEYRQLLSGADEHGQCSAGLVYWDPVHLEGRPRMDQPQLVLVGGGRVECRLQQRSQLARVQLRSRTTPRLLEQRHLRPDHRASPHDRRLDWLGLLAATTPLYRSVHIL